MGAPGSGKGTQSQRLVRRFGIPQISTGDLLRSAVARGTDYGKRAKAAMDSGQLVVDEIVLGIIRERLAERGCGARLHSRRFSAQPRRRPRRCSRCSAASAARSTRWCCSRSITTRSSSASRVGAAARSARACSVRRRRHRVMRPGAINVPIIRRWCSDPTTRKRPCAGDSKSTNARRDRWRSSTRRESLLRTIDADGPVDEVTARLIAALASVPRPRRSSSSERAEQSLADHVAPPPLEHVAIAGPRHQALHLATRRQNLPAPCRAHARSAAPAATTCGPQRWSAGSGRCRCGSGASFTGSRASSISAMICGPL